MKKVILVLIIFTLRVGEISAKVYDDSDTVQSAPQQQKEDIKKAKPPVKISVSFAYGGTEFIPQKEDFKKLKEASKAKKIFLSGRTSTLKKSWKDEQLAMGRALVARQWLVEKQGVDPLKIFINFVSARDFIADNDTKEGQTKNQRVEILLLFEEENSDGEI